MKKKMQWFKFYPKDFLDDEDVKAMDYEGIGLYIVMLSHCWTNDSMPIDEKKLARIFKLTPHKFKKLWNQVKDKFFEKNGRLFNKRILDEKEYLKKDFKEKSDIGKKNANKRWHPHDGTNANRISSAMQDPENPEKRIRISPVNPVSTPPPTEPKNNKSKNRKYDNKTCGKIAQVINDHRKVFEGDVLNNSPAMQKLFSALLRVPGIDPESQRLLAYVVQAKAASSDMVINKRLGYAIALLKEPKYAPSDESLQTAKELLNSWLGDSDQQKQVAALLPDLTAKT